MHRQLTLLNSLYYQQQVQQQKTIMLNRALISNEKFSFERTVAAGFYLQDGRPMTL